MILSIDLNPVLKRKYFLNSIEQNEINIAKNTICGPGGDGIELAYFLNGLNEDVLANGFLGGVNGSFIQKELWEANISHEFYKIKDETSDYIILNSANTETHICSGDPKITREEIGGFIELSNELIGMAKIICCTGKSPANVPKDIYYDIVRKGNDLNKKVLLALRGEELSYGLEAGPYMVVLDKDELECLTKLKLDFEYEIIKAVLYILDKGVRIAVITLGNRGSIVLTPEYVYRVNIPDISGDTCRLNFGYMLGGYSLALERNYDFDMMLKIGQACGVINCYEHDDIIDMSDIKRIMGEIEIGRFNY